MSEARRVILVIDDEDAIIYLVDSVLGDEGYRVITASNGGEGLRRLHTEARIDLVISDIMMPQMDGREVARRMRADARFDRIPLILMSAIGDDSAVRGLPHAAFLHKPFELDRLIALVARLIGGDAPRGDAEMPV